jgi:hypothetical protein
MAFVIDVRESVDPFGWRFFISTGAIKALAGFCSVVAAAALVLWSMASFATIHTSQAPITLAEGIRITAPPTVSPGRDMHRQADVRVSKFSRLPGITTVTDRMSGATTNPAPKEMASLLQRRGLALFAKRNNAADIASQLKAQAEVLASAAPVIGVTQAALLPTIQTAAAEPARPALPPIETALADTVAAEASFGLVLAPNTDIPLPMSRPAAAKAERPEAALAYARIDENDDETEMPKLGKPALAPVARKGVAIYDISTATVHMPNGERLEAHSGLGAMRDDPRHVDKKMRGATPPHTYNLAMREALFHGVEAIRLHPVGGPSAIHNRVGLLAHTYMLGKKGDSNGCVSFKDYKRFLAAFKRGQIKQLVVVARMKGGAPAKPTLASLFSKRSS